MKAEVNEIISRLDKNIRRDRRLSFLLRDWDDLMRYLDRDQKNKDDLLDEYLKILHFMEVGNSLPVTEKSKQLLVYAAPMSIARIVGDYNFEDHNQMLLARKRIQTRNERIRKDILETKQKEEEKRKLEGRSNMGRSKTPTISKIKRSKALDK